jgi:hypothetical protein
MRKARDFAMDIAIGAESRQITAADLFAAFAQIVADQNPALARKSLEALDAIVQQRVPLVIKPAQQ